MPVVLEPHVGVKKTTEGMYVRMYAPSICMSMSVALEAPVKSKNPVRENNRKACVCVCMHGVRIKQKCEALRLHFFLVKKQNIT